MFDYFWWNTAVLLMGSFAVYWIATQKLSRFSPAVFVLILSVLLGFFSYTRFGQMHAGKTTYHFDEIYVYYLGSKYYKEISQKYLFVSIVGAMEELRSTKKVPYIGGVRNLEQPFEVYSGQEAERIFVEKARSHFSDQRWKDFKDDISRLLDNRWSGFENLSLADVGYNPPPSFALVAGSVASLIKITPGTLTFMPFIDWSLVFIAACVVFRTFGFLAVSVFLLIYCNNDLCGMYWIGGGFCRHLFFFSLTMALCALDRKRYLWAGLAFGCAIAFRVFPMVFLFGACLPFLARLDRDWSKEYASVFKLAGGAFVSLGALVVISLCVYPATHWLDFFTKIALHGKTFFVMHLGYDKLAAYSYNTGPQYFDFNGISSFENWNIVLNDRFNEHWMFHRGVALLFTAGAVFASFRMEPKMASLIVGETILFFYALPANYYYIYLATFGVVVVTALKETALRGNSLRFWSLMGFVVFINLVGGFTGDAIVLNWWINLALFCLLFIYIISQLWHRPFDWREHKHQVFITLAIIACLALITFRPRVMPSTNTNGLKTQVLLFADKDVASGEWWMQDDHEYNPHMWPTKSQLVVKNTKGPVSVSKHFMIPEQRKYLITVFHSSNRDNVQAKVSISCKDYFEGLLATVTADFTFGKDTYTCELPAGPNHILITGMGNETNSYLGLNSIVLKPL